MRADRVDHDAMEAAVAAYALEALEGDEELRVEAHLPECAACRTLYSRCCQATDALALGWEEVRPPQELKRRILEAATASAPWREPAPAVRLLHPGAEAHEGRRPRQRRWRMPALWMAAAVVAVGLVSLGAWNVWLQQQLQRAPGRYALQGTGSLEGVQGSVTVYDPDVLTVVQVSGMPQPGPGQVYQLWLIGRDGPPVSAGLLMPDPQGSARVVLERSVQDVAAVAVTKEAGPDGAPAPTGRRELTAQIGDR